MWIKLAIETLYPDLDSRAYEFSGESYDGLAWDDSYGTAKPDRDTVEDKITELKNNWEASDDYAARAAAYPTVNDYLDAVVKGPHEVEAYIAKCKAIKAQYPKPTETSE